MVTVWHVRTEEGLALTICEQNGQPMDSDSAQVQENAFVWFDPAHIVTVRAADSSTNSPGKGAAHVR